MSFLQAGAAAEGPPGPLGSGRRACCSAPAPEEVEDILGGPSDLSRPVVPRNVVAEKARQVRVRAAVRRVAGEIEKQVRLGRLVLLGLALIQLARVSDLLVGGSSLLEGPYFSIQFLCVSSDLGCAAIAAPVLLQRLGGHSPVFEYMGPVITGVAALGMVDLCAFIAFLILAVRVPVSPGELRDSVAARWADAVFANVGVVEMTMAASISLQAALCVCTWRIYVSVREAGLYPAGDPARPLTKVSLLEIFCDEGACEEGCCTECCGAPDKAAAPEEAASSGAAAATPPASPRRRRAGPETPPGRGSKDGSVPSPETTAASPAARTAESSLPSSP